MSRRCLPAPAAARSTAEQRRNARVLQYLQIVRPLALHYSRCCREPLDDLLQVGMLGLLRAAELYNQDRAVPFEAFARPHVRGAILHYLRDSVGCVRLPRRQVEMLDRLRVLGREIECQQGRTPGSEELRRALGLSPEQWHVLRQGEQLKRAASLEGLVGTEPTALPDASREEVSGGHDDLTGFNGSSPTSVERLLANLDPALATLVRQVVLGGWSYRRVARQLQVSPMTARRWFLGALDQLRSQWGQLRLNPEGPAAGLGASVLPGC